MLTIFVLTCVIIANFYFALGMTPKQCNRNGILWLVTAGVVVIIQGAMKWL
jgi:hypothetical protein